MSVPNLTVHLDDPIYKSLPPSLTSIDYVTPTNSHAEIPNTFTSDSTKPAKVRRHVASLLPSYVDKEEIYDAKIRNKAIVLTAGKTYVGYFLGKS